MFSIFWRYYVDACLRDFFFVIASCLKQAGRKECLIELRRCQKLQLYQL